jgi:flavin-binding protein dodecin
VAEVDRLDVNLSDDGQILEYRIRLKVSLKHEAK